MTPDPQARGQLRPAARKLLRRQVRSAAVFPDGRKIVTASWDKTAKVTRRVGWCPFCGVNVPKTRSIIGWTGGDLMHNPGGRWIRVAVFSLRSGVRPTVSETCAGRFETCEGLYPEAWASRSMAQKRKSGWSDGGLGPVYSVNKFMRNILNLFNLQFNSG